MQGQSLLTMPADRELTAPHFVLGLAVFLAGLATNLHSDTLLLNLRRPGGEEGGTRLSRFSYYKTRLPPPSSTYRDRLQDPPWRGV